MKDKKDNKKSNNKILIIAISVILVIAIVAGLAFVYMQNNKNKDEKKRRYGIMKYVCDLCGWEYDEEQGYPEGGIAPGTKWEDVPEDFECPLCSAGKDQFSEE